MSGFGTQNRSPDRFFAPLSGFGKRWAEKTPRRHHVKSQESPSDLLYLVDDAFQLPTG